MALSPSSILANLRTRLAKYRVAKARRLGVHIPDDCKLHGMPHWGSEPYLITIGKNVNLSGKVIFLTHDGSVHLFRKEMDVFALNRFGRIVIHDNCFIGWGAVLLPGVSIGPNSIVAAGAVVVADVPPDTVVWGNPARPLMSTQAYKEKIVEKSIELDRARYNSNRKEELERVYPSPW